MFVADGENGLEILQIEVLSDNTTTTESFDFGVLLTLAGAALLVGLVIVAFWQRAK